MLRRALLVFALSCTGAAFAGSGVAGAATLYAATGGKGDNGATTHSGVLFALDPTTAAATTVGPIGFGVTGLAVDPTSGVLYGSTTTASAASPNSIITVNKRTGAGTLVGPTGLGSGVADIAFDSSGQLWGWSEDSDELVSLDKATGTATVIGSDNAGSQGDGMSFDSSDVLYAMIKKDNGDLRTIDTATGNGTVVAPLTGSPQGGHNMTAASFGCDGSTLYSLDGLDGQQTVNLVTVDTATGVITDIGLTTDGMDGLVWDCTPTGTLFGATGGNGNDSTTNSGVLYTLDPATGAAAAIGSIGFGVTGLAVEPITGVLYASTTTNSLNAPNSVITINKSTGAGTLVGPTGDTNGIADLAFDASGTLWGWSEDGDDLVTVDKATGAVTHVGDGPGSAGDGMSFIWSGTLYAMLNSDSGTLDVVDTSTGTTTPGPTLTGSPYGNRSIPGASFDCAGTTLFAIDGLGNTPPVANLVTVDVTTGAITNIGQTADRMDGLEWDCFGSPASAPPSSGGGGGGGGGGGAAALPVVTAVAPASGPAGTTVGITGDGFSTASQVLFGTTPASFVIDGYKRLTAIAPPGIGTVDVRVVNPAGTSAVSASDLFVYSAVLPGGAPVPNPRPSCPSVPKLSRRTIRGARKYMDRAGCNVPLRVGKRVPLKRDHRRRVVSQTPAAGGSTSGPVTINMGYID